jgi:hypothetical protein
MHGTLIAYADVGFNSAIGGNIGVMHILFNNGTNFECHFPPGEISGLVMGARKYRMYGRGYIIEKKNKLFA